MTWKDRVKPTIEFTSPKGQNFTANWIGDPRTQEKKLGIFSYPKVAGAVVQDLDVGASTYPITIYFEGENHDIQSERFFNACKEFGEWFVGHPLLGGFNAVLIRVTENIQPVTNSNITIIDTEWTDFLVTNFVRTVPELSGNIGSKLNDLNLSSAAQFAAKVKQKTFSLVQKIKDTTNNITTFVNDRLEPLFSTVAEVNAAVSSVQRSIQDTLDAVILDPLKLAGQIQQLIQLPALVTSDFTARIDAYGNLASDIFGLNPEDSTADSFNIASTQEIALSAVLGESAVVSSNSEFLTRGQTIEAINAVSGLFITITDNLDASQELFIGLTIDNQYFSQSESFSDAATITAQANALLLVRSFDLAIEKRIILTKSRTPIDVTITEYGSLGNQDSNLDLFIQSNNLKSNDILLLPAGREVVVYV